MALTTKHHKILQGRNMYLYRHHWAVGLSCSMRESSWSYKIIPVMVGGVNNYKNIGRWLCRWVAEGLTGGYIRHCNSLISPVFLLWMWTVTTSDLCVYYLKDSVQKSSRRWRAAAMASKFLWHSEDTLFCAFLKCSLNLSENMWLSTDKETNKPKSVSMPSCFSLHICTGSKVHSFVKEKIC